MSAAAISPVVEVLGDPQLNELTLLDLVQAVCDVAESEEEIIATVIHMLQSGRVRLTGNFRNATWS